MSAMAGASKNRNLFAFAGRITSLISSLMTSANGWPRPGNKPKSRTRFGPRRSCIQPMTLRSQSVVQRDADDERDGDDQNPSGGDHRTYA